MRMVRVWLPATLCLALGLALVPASGGIEGNTRAAYADCAACHVGIEYIGTGHPTNCAPCHLPPHLRGAAVATHDAVISNPGAPEHADESCGPCHPDEVRAVHASVHATLAGLIYRTRMQWGATSRPRWRAYGVGPGSPPLPPGAGAPRSPAMLVDDFLRAYCLHCHIGERGPDAPGLRRSRGCGACHMHYADHGYYDGNDKALAGAFPNRPVRHELTVPKDDTPCLACHRENHTGADLYGRFQRDPTRIHRVGGAEMQLRRDVHAERGMGCLDCHRGTQIMGMNDTRPSCRSCHGDTNVYAPGEQRVLMTRDGRVLRPPRPRFGTPGHDPMLHGRVRCEACHAQWFFGDYGLDVLCLDAPPTDTRTARALARGDNGELYHGIRAQPDANTPGRRWLVGWRIRRWEHAPLGLDRHGRVAVLRPRHLFAVSYVSPSGRVVMNTERPKNTHGLAAYVPYTPHTTGDTGRMCTDCHRNSLAVGLGVDGKDDDGWAPSNEGFDILRVGPEGSLPADMRRRLLNPSARWAEEFSRHIDRTLEAR